jgi:iron-sulfur cluster repair protein YtfE (RIC family)
MNVTDVLLGEHGACYGLFAYLEEAAPGDLRAGAALLAAVIVPHARFENERLFPALEARIGPDGPLAVMRAEHEEIESGLAALRTVEDPAALRRGLRHVIAVARQHFQKEEVVVFPLAARELGPGLLERLGQEWAAARGVTLG